MCRFPLAILSFAIGLDVRDLARKEGVGLSMVVTRVEKIEDAPTEARFQNGIKGIHRHRIGPKIIL